MAKIGVDNSPQMQCVRTYQSALETLTSAVFRLKSLAQDAPTADERNEAAAEGLKLEQQMHLEDEKWFAWLKGGRTVNAPSPTQIDTAAKLADKVAAENAADAKVNAIVDIANKSLDLLAKLHK